MRTILLSLSGVGLFVALLMAIAVWFGPYPNAGRTTRMTTVKLIVNGHRFQVPGARLIRWRLMRLGGEVDAIAMDGVLPDLAPFSNENAQLYESSEGRRQLVRFGVWPTRGTGIREDYFEPAFLETCSDEWRGHLICPTWPDDSELFIRQEGKKKIAIECSAVGSVPEPLCDLSLPLLPRAYIRLLIHRNYLNDYTEIVSRVYEVVCDYYVPDTSHRLAYSYCNNGIYHGPRSND